MSKQKLTKADLKRMEDLSKKMAADKKQAALDKQKAIKLKKEVDAEKKKLANQWKELKNEKKKHQDNVKFAKGVASKNDKKSSSKGGVGPSNKKLQAELLEMKQKFNHEGKRARQFKQRVDQLEAENKVLQKKLKNLQGRKEKGEDPRIKSLMRENKGLKSQVKLLMIELNKKRRWFQRCIKSFKSSRQKWIKQQEDTLKKKGFLIKYVFVDDVKKIQGYAEPVGNKKKGGKGGGKTKYRNKVKIKSRDGGVVVLKDIEFVVLDNDDDNDDDGDKKKGGKKKKNKKNKGQQMEDMENYMDELAKEFELDQEAIGGGDDAKLDSDDDFDFDEELDGLDGDYKPPLSVDADADDVGGKNSINSSPRKSPRGGKKTPRSPSKSSGGKSPKPKSDDIGNKNDDKKNDYLSLPAAKSIDTDDSAALSAQLVYVMQEMDARTDDIEKIKEITSDGDKYPDPKKAVNEYILQINKRGDELVDKLDKEVHSDKIDDVKQSNNQWQLWINKLSDAMAKNGELFNKLIDVSDFYLKELRGRVIDLKTVNTTYYNDKTDDDDDKKEENEENNDENNENDDDGGDAAADDGGDEEEKKEEVSEKDKLSELKEIINKRHVEVEEQFKSSTEKEDVEAEEEEKKSAENYGAENKEQEKIDTNTQKVRDIRDGLINTNCDWKKLVGDVTTDYTNSVNEKNKLFSGLNEAGDELKSLIDLVCKIPKRKILDDGDDDDNKNDDDNNDGDNDADNNEEPAAGGDDDNDDGGDE